MILWSRSCGFRASLSFAKMHVRRHVRQISVSAASWNCVQAPQFEIFRYQPLFSQVACCQLTPRSAVNPCGWFCERWKLVGDNLVCFCCITWSSPKTARILFSRAVATETMIWEQFISFKRFWSWDCIFVEVVLSQGRTSDTSVQLATQINPKRC